MMPLATSSGSSRCLAREADDALLSVAEGASSRQARRADGRKPEGRAGEQCDSRGGRAAVGEKE